MATPNVQKNTKVSSAKNAGVLFTKENQKWMIIGGVLMVEFGSHPRTTEDVGS
jgi:hypothetical protein